MINFIAEHGIAIIIVLHLFIIFSFIMLELGKKQYIEDEVKRIKEAFKKIDEMKKANNE